jgi:hypothetical protein
VIKIVELKAERIAPNATIFVPVSEAESGNPRDGMGREEFL